MKIGGKEFQTQGKTYICGILNVTPDSFSDGGRFNRMDQALYHVEEMIGDGMDLLDIGGESARPGYTLISVQEEVERVVPVLEAVKARFDIPVSLDTYKYEVAREGIRAGADLINDIWGLRYDEGQMAALIARSGLPCCLMHNREAQIEGDFLPALLGELKEILELAQKAGIGKEQILLDPGVGFGKSYEQNLEVLANLDHMTGLGCPLLLGTSRKSVIGLTLDVPAGERLEGTLVTTVLAALAGCMFVRVHDVKENKRAVRMAEAILARRREG